MDQKFYAVVKIEGEYAYLREEGCSMAEDLFIALALLPVGTDISSRLLYKNMEFSLI